jgi:YD repeat-containing protein
MNMIRRQPEFDVEHSLRVVSFRSAKKKLVQSLFALLVAFAITCPMAAQTSSPVQYVHDALGRLIKVVDTSGNVATYNYDAVGNLLSITRSTLSTTAPAILSFSPTQGPVGQTVTIQGQNFATTTTGNTVQFNGTAATVTAASANSLTVSVPTGATTGPITVTVGSSTATSSSNFTVLTIPVIASISPTLGLAGIVQIGVDLFCPGK